MVAQATKERRDQHFAKGFQTFFLNETFMDNKTYKKIIEEMACEKCHDYCFLKQIILSISPKADLLIQLKCIEKFKYEESERQKKDIGWNLAGILWADKGFAKSFRNIVLKNDSLSAEEIYTLIMQKNS